MTITVDTTANMMRVYVDGEQSVEITSPKVGRDGQFALKGRLALLYARSRRDDDDAEYDSVYVRAVSVHNRILSAEAIKGEAAAYERMLLEDAIGAAPRHYRAPLAEMQLDEPADSLAELKERLVEMRDAVGRSATDLWAALLMRDERSAADVLGGLNAHQPMQLSHWRSPNVEADESAGIPGEHLLHAAAFAANSTALELLLNAAEDEAALCEREISTNSIGGVERAAAGGAAGGAVAGRGRLERSASNEPPPAIFVSSGRMLLLERGNDDPTGVRRKLVNRRGAKTKCTPLHAAASAGHAHVISKLIDAGALRPRARHTAARARARMHSLRVGAIDGGRWPRDPHGRSPRASSSRPPPAARPARACRRDRRRTVRDIAHAAARGVRQGLGRGGARSCHRR